MKDAIGGKVTLMAKIGASDRVRGKVCLENVSQNGVQVSDHEWVDYDQSRMRNLIKGDVIRFTALVIAYKGMDENDCFTDKVGLTNLRSIERVI